MYTSRKCRWLVAAGLLCVAVSASALKTDRNQPINIQADHGDFTNDSGTNTGTGVYTGHVLITQGSIRITADKAVLHMRNGEIQTADITGSPASFQQQPDSGARVTGTAAEITYSQNTDEVDLSGNAELHQGERLLTADVIHYNTSTEHVIALGGKSNERVHITIPPKAATHTPPA